ncbi:MAG: hypothetical protein RQ715_09070 [Methylococcales bacterium]|nr:hypothetical protein [Methylococcales bacterium]
MFDQLCWSRQQSFAGGSLRFAQPKPAGLPALRRVFWKFLTDLIAGRQPELDYQLVRYD